MGLIYNDRFFPQWSRTRKAPDFSPVVVANAMVAAFNDQADDMLAEQLAKDFVAAFFPYRKPFNPRTVRGCCVLERRAWVDDFHKKWHGDARYSYDSVQRTRRALETLMLIASRVTPEFADALRVESAQFVAGMEADRWGLDGHACATVGPIKLRLFQTKVEFHVPPEIAQAINLFVSTHAAEAIRDLAA